jgi:hypothetical protein
VANGEAWAEGPEIGDSKLFLDEWNRAGLKIPVAASCLSSETSNFARNFDWQAWLAQPGAAIMPQVYGASHSGYTVQAALGSLAHTPVSVNRLNLTFDINENGEGPFADYSTWKGPRSVWTGDYSEPSTWVALTR